MRIVTLIRNGRSCRTTLVHDLQAHEDEKVNSVLSSLARLDVDDTPLPDKLKEMDMAMVKLVMKRDDPVKVAEIAKDTEMQGGPSRPTPMDTETPRCHDPACYT